MDGNSMGLFLMASVAVTLAPGPDNLFVLAQGISHERRSALLAAWGMVSGLSVHTALAAMGVSAVILASPWAFTTLRGLGAGYLFFLAWVTFRERNRALGVGKGVHAASDVAMFRRGFLMNVLNPKVGLFFLAFLPQFADPGVGNPAVAMLRLGLVFMVQAWVCFSLIAVFAAGIGSLLRHQAGLEKGLKLMAALMFAALGLKLVLESGPQVL